LWRSSRCDVRVGCPDCARRLARAEIRELAPVVYRVATGADWHVRTEGEPPRGTVLLLTLTHRPCPTSRLRTALDAHYGAFRRWQRSRGVSRELAGGRWSLEVTRREDAARPWHAHSHHL